MPIWRSVLLAGLTALLVAQPLVPSEAAAFEGHGAALTLLWFLLLLAWAVGRFRLDSLPLQFGVVDSAVLALVIWHTLSALIAWKTGSPRPALNMLWEWAALTTGFFLARQLIDRPQIARALVAVMLSVAVGVSLIGYWQFFYQMPRDQEHYERIKDNPQAVYELTGHWYPPGSSQLKNFENRLRSKEPFATFSLTNSLAGFLLPWLIMLVGLGLFARGDPASTDATRSELARRRVVLIAAGILISGCLLLTKSRSACLAALIGLAFLWPACHWQRSKKRHSQEETDSTKKKNDSRRLGGRMFKRIAAIGALFVALAVVGSLVGGLDKEVLTEAGKSLGYRGQYWRSTLAMIGDNPLFGVGPGQFRDNYTQYKLPEASEEIQDPHNFLLEVGATAGAPALLAMLFLIGLLLWKTWRPSNIPNEIRALNSSDERTTKDRSSRRAREKKREQDDLAGDSHRLLVFLACGAGGGVLLAALIRVLIGFSVDPIAIAFCLLATTVMLWGLWPWVTRGALPPRLPTLAAITMLINLLAAGGLGYSGVAGSWWLLCAIGLFTLTPAANETSAAEREPKAKSGSTSPGAKISAWVTVSVAGALFLLCYQTMYSPVMRSGSELQRASSLSGTIEENFSSARVRSIESALLSDPISHNVARRLANERYNIWHSSSSPDALQRFNLADQEMLRLQPQSHSAWALSAFWRADVFRHTGDQAEGQAAIEKYRKSLERYPTHARTRAELALLLAEMNQTQAASVEAQAAIAQDEITRAAGHVEKTLSETLPEESYRRLQELAQPDSSKQGNSASRPDGK